MSGRAIAKIHTPELLAHAGALHDQRLSKHLDISIDAMHNDLQCILKTSSKPILANCGRRVTSRHLPHEIIKLVDSHWYHPQAGKQSNDQGLKELWRQGGQPVGPDPAHWPSRTNIGDLNTSMTRRNDHLAVRVVRAAKGQRAESSHECGSSRQS
jgi:hypothetical protein